MKLNRITKNLYSKDKIKNIKEEEWKKYLLIKIDVDPKLIEEEKYRCDICKYLFIKRQINRHRTIHNQEN